MGIKLEAPVTGHICAKVSAKRGHRGSSRDKAPEDHFLSCSRACSCRCRFRVPLNGNLAEAPGECENKSQNQQCAVAPLMEDHGLLMGML